MHRRRVTLVLLTTALFFAFLDRQIISILLEPIKNDLSLNDTQLGLISGMAFAIFYSTLGLPISRLADRYNRINIISISMVIWSMMTALGGFAQNFTHLFLSRIGVGMGEAGGGPPAHSIISDLYPPQQRAGAMTIYFLGVILGAGFGTMIGGYIASLYGWRVALIAVGLPGILVAIVLKLFAVEPVRGKSEPDAKVVPSNEGTSIIAGTAIFVKSPIARHLLIAVTITSVVELAIATFLPAFFIRSFGVAISDVGLLLGLTIMSAGIMSSLAIAFSVNFLAKRYGIFAQAYLVFFIKVLAFPLLVLMYLADSFHSALLFYAVATLIQAGFVGPVFALIQNQAPLEYRATWAAFTMFSINLVGFGLGPLAVGLLSDFYRATQEHESLRYACLTVCAVYPWAIWHYWRAAILLKNETNSASLTVREKLT